eukprot:gene68-91_t
MQCRQLKHRAPFARFPMYSGLRYGYTSTTRLCFGKIIKNTMQELNHIQIAQRLDQLTELSVALGASHETDELLERILMVAKALTHADGGTLYRPSADGASLCFHISVNDTLGIRQGGARGDRIDIPA